MTTSLINVFAPNAFIVQSDNGAAYDLLSANVVTGVVTSSYLPAAATDFLTVRLQKLLVLLPSLSATALKTLIRNLVVLDQLEGGYTATVTATGDNYALGLSDLETPSNMQVSVPFSTSSPFTGNGAPVGDGTWDTNTYLTGTSVGNTPLIITSWSMVARDVEQVYATILGHGSAAAYDMYSGGKLATFKHDGGVSVLISSSNLWNIPSTAATAVLGVITSSSNVKLTLTGDAGSNWTWRVWIRRWKINS